MAGATDTLWVEHNFCNEMIKFEEKDQETWVKHYYMKSYVVHCRRIFLLLFKFSKCFWL